MVMKKDFTISRRSFLKWSAAVGSSMSLVGCMPSGQVGGSTPALAQAGNRHEGAKELPSMCWHNCGGRCQLKGWVKDGVVLSFSTDNVGDDTLEDPQARACPKGRSQRQRLYSPDRLKYPVKRVGERGEGKFEQITWDEALDTVASELKRVIGTYGNEALYFNYASGSGGVVNQSYVGGPAARLFNMLGGFLSFYGNYSQAQYMSAIPYMFGSSYGGSSPTTFLKAKLIVMFGDNPANTRVGGLNSSYYLKLAKKNGTRIIVIDPLHTDTASTFADQWIPIRPTTDSALAASLAYVIITEGLHDQEFLNNYCVGFDEEHMPDGVPAGSSYKSYILGESDGVAKTPEWASKRCGIPTETIIMLAREIGGAKPCFILQGRGMQRHAYGESMALSVALLGPLTGNVGIAGSNPGMYETGPAIKMGSFPTLANPIKTKISFYLFTDAIERGKEFTKANSGLQGADKLSSDIKFIFNYAGNSLINQHGDTSRTAKLLKDTSKCEFILGMDTFMTSSMQYCDIVLPGTTQFESEDICSRSLSVGMAVFGHKLVEPLYDCRTPYDIFTDLADRFGLKDKFTEGKTEEDFLKAAVTVAQAAHKDFPSYEEFKTKGIYKTKPIEVVAYKAFREDPVANPLKTPSGKIEIFSKLLFDMNNPKEIPAVPKYIPAWEGPEDPLKDTYPLQCIGHHSKRRVHSTFDNIPWLEEAEAQRVWVNTKDAENRGIMNGDMVKIFNERGTVMIPARVTPRITPGVCSIPQGAWYTPDKNGVDIRGCTNTLTTWKHTPLAWGNPQHTNLVQIEKVKNA
ncbi:MAG TPA: DMSO/selenate family reductase complex A subunit [Desulfosporosinus sp.]|nr:DMSO/selenate family reductase complex A subunit [Desulfosporosinus sp.]